MSECQQNVAPPPMIVMPHSIIELPSGGRMWAETAADGLVRIVMDRGQEWGRQSILLPRESAVIVARDLLAAAVK